MSSTRAIIRILFLSCCCSAAWGRTVRDIASLKSELGFRPPKTTAFDFSAKVIAPCTAQNKVFVVTDGTNAIELVDEAHWPKIAFARNDILHLVGRIREKGNPDCLQIDVIGAGVPEPVAELTVNDIANGQHDLKLVRVRGTVRSARQDEIDPAWAFIALYDKGNAIQIELMPSQDEFRDMHRLVDAEVSVIGISKPQRWQKHFSRRFSPASLLVGSLSDFTVIHPACDPFETEPLEPETFFLGNSSGDRRRTTTGHVLAAYNGTHVVLRDSRGDILNVEFSADETPPLGARIRVAGYPATDLYRLNLTDAVWRPEAGQPMPSETPKPTTLAQLLTDGQGHTQINHSSHGHLLRVRGIARTLPGIENASKRIMLESEQLAIAVAAEQCPQVLADLSSGCEIEATGICVMPTDNWRPGDSIPRIREVFIALRSASDIRVLSHPPWWTPARLFVLLLALTMVIAVVLVWNRLLKRTIERRSRELLNEQIAHVTSDLKTMERTRLAIELHDSLAQNLTGVALQLQTARETIREDVNTAAVHLETADRSLLSCREELRNCLRDLRSEALETDDINEAIRMTLIPHIGDTSTTIRFNVPRERLTDNTLHTVLRIIRELVLNAIRHGQATSIRVAGAIEDGRLLFSVSDNGRGFDPDNRPGPRDGHFGLQGIRERINDFNGTFEIDSKPGHGTKATLALLLPRGDKP